MAYYCGECAVWQGSSDTNQYGERWCAYDRKYRSSDQNIHDCRGFLYTGRAIITKVCEILDIPADELFASYDRAKEEYVLPRHRCWLARYSQVGPALADKLDQDQARAEIARDLLDHSLLPASRLCKDRKYQEAAARYIEMVQQLRERYRC